jgi:hypothetical protein
MTSQTYQAADDQLMQEDSQAVPENNLTEPEADPMATDTHLAEPEADPMATDTHLAEPEAGQERHEDPTSHPSGEVAPADHESPASILSGYPGFTPDGDDGGREPAMADSSPGSPSLVSGAFTVPESASESHLAVNTASAHGPWNEIQAMFVDDPRASIEQAAALVNDRVETLIHSVTERQRSMQSAWQADDAGTEELRVALQHYRTFWNSLDDLPAQA